MSLHRFFIAGPLPEGGAKAWTVPLAERDRRHLGLVLRLAPGERVMLAGPDGAEAEAVLREVSPEGVVADVAAPTHPPKRPRVSLAQGLARRERMELVVQKATELGVAEILPVSFARSVVKLEERKRGERSDRWRRIAEEAAKQSQRADVPLVRDLVDARGLARAAAEYDVVLVPWEETVGAAERSPGIPEALAEAGAGPDASVLVVIGPEGGLEPAEVDALVAAGGRVVSMGDTVLRTETAAIVAVALAMHALGGLGGAPRG